MNQQFEDTLRRAFVECDEQIAKEVEGSEGCGSTAGVVLVRKEAGRRVLHVANCGDVRATLCRGNVGVRLSVDHKADTAEERARVEAAGGQVIGRRVQGVLAVARALGDHALKRFVTGEPFVATVELQAGDSHLVLACDGLWDVMSDQDVCDVIRDMPEDTSCLSIAKQLIAKAIALRTSDNVSVVVAKLILSDEFQVL
jgi:protein phosphatase PTC1